jgi:hypothetical protein
MDPHAGYVVQRPSIHCDPSASIAKQMLNPMSNKHKRMWVLQLFNWWFNVFMEVLWSHFFTYV